MKFVIKVAHADTPLTSWDEDYNRPECKTLAEAEAWAKKTLANFNDSLRPGEKPRVLLAVVEQDNEAIAPHEWTKTNLVTIVKKGTSYDTMLCLNCGITGKRHGLGDCGVERDKKYKAEKYASCERRSK